MFRRQATRPALTLFELVIVLAILAAIAASASVAADRILSRRRMELTQQTLAVFQRSILGSYGKAEAISTVALAGSEPTLDGFVADLGRPPAAVGSDPQTQLAELWSNPAGMAPYGRKQAADEEVFLHCGWRGPYVDLPVGAQSLSDGWGRPLRVLTRDESGAPQLAAPGNFIYGVMSLGSDGADGVTTTELPLAEDYTMWLGDPLSSPLHANITVTVWQDDGEGGRIAPSGPGSLLIVLYLPNPTTGNIGSLTSPTSPPLTGPFSTPPSYTFANVPIGSKVLRAYWTSAPAEGEEGEGTALKSPVTPIDVRRGGQTAWELVLPWGGL